MRVVAAAALAASLVLQGCDAPSEKAPARAAAPQSNGIVSLSPSDMIHLGLATEEARPAIFTPQVHGYGTVLSSLALTQMDADIRTAEAAVTLSKANLDRMVTLAAANAIPRQTLDMAVHQATADEVQLALVDRREAGTYGPDAPWRKTPRDDDILASVASGKATIVQTTFPLDVDFTTKPSSLRVTHLNVQPREISGAVAFIWRAPSDPTIPGQSYYALVENSDLEQGEHVLVYAPTGAPVAGVRISPDAIVLAEQKPWCYVLVGPREFRRVAVDLTRPFEGGYFLSAGVAPHQQVLVKGTGLLLARELGAAAPAQD